MRVYYHNIICYLSIKSFCTILKNENEGYLWHAGFIPFQVLILSYRYYTCVT